MKQYYFWVAYKKVGGCHTCGHGAKRQLTWGGFVSDNKEIVESSAKSQVQLSTVPMEIAVAKWSLSRGIDAGKRIDDANEYFSLYQCTDDDLESVARQVQAAYEAAKHDDDLVNNTIGSLMPVR